MQVRLVGRVVPAYAVFQNHAEPAYVLRIDRFDVSCQNTPCLRPTDGSSWTYRHCIRRSAATRERKGQQEGGPAKRNLKITHDLRGVGRSSRETV
eukprot:3926189-Rhodomonas_salina.1